MVRSCSYYAIALWHLVYIEGGFFFYCFGRPGAYRWEFRDS